MATRHRPLPVTDGNIDQTLLERAGMRREAGLESMPDSLGRYLADDREGFVARFRQAQQALASHDVEQIRQLGDKARQDQAETIVANYPNNSIPR